MNTLKETLHSVGKRPWLIYCGIHLWSHLSSYKICSTHLNTPFQNCIVKSLTLYRKWVLFFPQEKLATHRETPLEPSLYGELTDRPLWTVWHFFRSALPNCPLLACDWESLDQMTGYAKYGWKDDKSEKEGDLWMTGNCFLARVLFNWFESGPPADGARIVWLCCFGENSAFAHTRAGNARFDCIDFLPLAVIKLLWTRPCFWDFHFYSWWLIV